MTENCHKDNEIEKYNEVGLNYLKEINEFPDSVKNDILELLFITKIN